MCRFRHLLGVLECILKDRENYIILCRVKDRVAGICSIACTVSGRVELASWAQEGGDKQGS